MFWVQITYYTIDKKHRCIYSKAGRGDNYVRFTNYIIIIIIIDSNNK